MSDTYLRTIFTQCKLCVYHADQYSKRKGKQGTTREYRGIDLHEGAQQGKALAYEAMVWQAPGARVLRLAEAAQNSIAKMAHLAAQK